MKIRVATRGSKLSLIQTEMFLNQIKSIEPDVEFEIITVKTSGDLAQDKPLYAIGVKGVFEKEVNLAVLRGEADMAVHSLKDLPSEIHEELVVAGYSKRDPPYDVVASLHGYTVYDLPRGARVGTSSVRRAAFIKNIRPDLRVETLRGNVDTRVNKVIQGVVDAAILAEAGLVRLYGGKPPLEIRRVRPEDLPPAPGQGIAAAVAKAKDGWMVDLLRKASDPKAALEARAERTFLREVGASCHTAIGGMASASTNGVEFVAGYATQDGGRRVVVKIFGEDSEEVGLRAARTLKELIYETGHRQPR